MNFVALDLLIDALHSLPGIGNKAAEKIAMFLIQQDEVYIDTFVKRIYDVKTKIGFCKICNNLANNNTLICDICSNPDRKKDVLCVVNEITDLKRFENAAIFLGRYHVLHGELSLKKQIGLNKLKISNLIDQLNNNDNLKEVIVATNPTIDGEITAKAIHDLCSHYNMKIAVYRLGYGIPYNSQINYVDDYSLQQSLANKQPMQVTKKENSQK